MDLPAQVGNCDRLPKLTNFDSLQQLMGQQTASPDNQYPGRILGIQGSFCP